MTKTIAILQSGYIPWSGYLDLMRSVDEFVILDSVQFTKNDWRNRIRIRIGSADHSEQARGTIRAENRRSGWR